MKVKFLSHFGGRETSEIHYEKNQIAELDDNTAADLLKRGICEALVIKAAPVEPQPEEKPQAKPHQKAVKK